MTKHIIIHAPVNL